MSGALSVKSNETRDNLYKHLLNVSRLTTDRPGKNSSCPKVGVIIATHREEGWEVLCSASHCFKTSPTGNHTCTHAEEEAVSRWHEMEGSMRDCTFFTTLEPCTQRSEMMCDCANRMIGAGVKKVVVGLLDPDPYIFGRGVTRLMANGVAVSYMPKWVRTELRKQDQAFHKRKREEYRIDKFKERLPFFVTSHDLEGYLRTAHALLRMYNGNKVVWFYPELPSLADDFRFHAWWSQGLLVNHDVQSVEIFISKRALEESVRLSAAAVSANVPYIEYVLEEIKDEAKVTVYVSPDDRARKSLILFYDQGDRLEYLIQALKIPVITGAADNRRGPHVALAVLDVRSLSLHGDVEEEITRVRSDGGESFFDAISRVRREI